MEDQGVADLGGRDTGVLGLAGGRSLRNFAPAQDAALSP